MAVTAPAEQGAAGVADVLSAIHAPFVNDYDGHLQRDDHETCRYDQERWPCQTMRAVEAYLDAEVARRVDAEKAAAVKEALDRVERRFEALIADPYYVATTWSTNHLRRTIREARRPAPEDGEG